MKKDVNLSCKWEIIFLLLSILVSFRQAYGCLGYIPNYKPEWYTCVLPVWLAIYIIDHLTQKKKTHKKYSKKRFYFWFAVLLILAIISLYLASDLDAKHLGAIELTGEIIIVYLIHKQGY